MSGGTGFNASASDRFLEFEGGSPIGNETDGWDTLESDFGGHVRRAQRGLSTASCASRRSSTRRSTTRPRRDSRRDASRSGAVEQRPHPASDGVRTRGDLAFGELILSDGRFDLTESERVEQFTGYAGLGLRPRRGRQPQARRLGLLHGERERDRAAEGERLPPELRLLPCSPRQAARTRRSAPLLRRLRHVRLVDRADGARRASDDAAPRVRSGSRASREQVVRDRARLLLYQLNGDHRFEAIEGLQSSWAANHAKTTQDEKALGARFFFEPDDPDADAADASSPSTSTTSGPGRFAANSGDRLQHERHRRGPELRAPRRDLRDGADGRADRRAEHRRLVRARGARRGLDLSREPDRRRAAVQFASSATPRRSSARTSSTRSIGRPTGDLARRARPRTNPTARSRPGASGSRPRLWRTLDLLGGFASRRIFIESLNDPFTGEHALRRARDLSRGWLFFDRFDNPARRRVRSPAAARHVLQRPAARASRFRSIR